MKRTPTPKQQMRSRRDRFVVGYLGAKNIVVGRENDPAKDEYVLHDATEPLTRFQAERRLNAMPCGRCAIFELVPVKVNR